MPYTSAVYTEVKRTAGSSALICSGRQMLPTTISRTLSFDWSISDCDLRFGLPESLRRRAARRRRMLGDDVSGRKNMRLRKTGPESQSISQSDQRQFSAATLNPEIRGPRAGPQVAKVAQPVRK